MQTGDQPAVGAVHAGEVGRKDGVEDVGQGRGKEASDGDKLIEDREVEGGRGGVGLEVAEAHVVLLVVSLWVD